MGEGTAGEGEQRMLLVDGVKYEVWTPPSEDALGESHLPTGDLTAWYKPGRLVTNRPGT